MDMTVITHTWWDVSLQNNKCHTLDVVQRQVQGGRRRRIKSNLPANVQHTFFHSTLARLQRWLWIQTTVREAPYKGSFVKVHCAPDTIQLSHRVYRRQEGMMKRDRA